MPQAQQADEKTKQEHRCCNQGGDIERSVLPQFSPYRPVERPESHGDSLWLRERSRRRYLLSAHRAAPCALPACLLITATNKSAMLGVCTSPSCKSWPRSTRSNVKTLRPNATRSWIGLSPRPAAICSGRTVTSA